MWDFFVAKKPYESTRTLQIDLAQSQSLSEVEDTRSDTMAQDTDFARFANLVQALPPELFDCVFDLTFTANHDTLQINELYQPPNCLQVSERTRKIFTRSYYNCTIFHATYNDCRTWIKSLPRDHVRCLSEVRIDDSLVHKGNIRSRPKFLKRFNEAYWKMVLPNGPSEEPLYKDMSAISGADLFKFRVVDEASSVERWMSLHDAFNEYVDYARWRPS